MSLTILVHKSLPVSIIRWFLDAKGNLIFASGPVIQIPLDEFRVKGDEWIHRHFEEFHTTRLSREKLIKPFKSGEAARLMKKRRVLQIHIDPQKNLIFSPMVVEKYSLGDLKRVKPLAEQDIPLSSSPEVFWKTFDEVLAIAPEAT